MLFVQVCMLRNIQSDSSFFLWLQNPILKYSSLSANMTAHQQSLYKVCEQDTNCTTILIRVQVVIILRVCEYVAIHCCNTRPVTQETPQRILYVYLESVFVVSLSYFHYLDILNHIHHWNNCMYIKQ